MPHATAQQWSTSPTTSQPNGGGLYNPANTDLYNNPRYGYVGVGVMRPRAKLHIHECTYNQFVTGSGTSIVNGLVGQLQGIYTELTTHSNQLNVDYKLITPATPEQGALLYAFASRVDSLRGAYEHYYQTVQATRLPPGTPEQMTACTGSASVCENRQTTLEAQIEALQPTVDTLPGIQSYLTTLGTVITTGGKLRTVGNQLIQTIFANSSLNRSLSCNSLPAGSTSPTSNVQLLLTNEHSPKVTTQPNGITVPSQGLLMGLARDVGYVFNQIGTGMYFLTAGGSQPAIAIDRVAGEGRVGINVTDPQATLDVRGTSFRLGSNLPGALEISRIAGIGSNSLGIIRFRGLNVESTVFETPSLNVSDRIFLGENATIGGVDVANRLGIRVGVPNAARNFIDCSTDYADNSTVRFRVDETGQAYIHSHTRIDGCLGVGLTTGTPSARLHVRFNQSDVQQTTDAGTGLILDRVNAASGSPTPMRNRISFRINNAETWAMGVDPYNDGSYQFYLLSQGNTYPEANKVLLRVHPYGTLGIGVTAGALDTAANNGMSLVLGTGLTVNGVTVLRNDVRVKGNMSLNGELCARRVFVRDGGDESPCTFWPDYVFRPGYALRTLPELQAYIQEHQHLPGVPSEDDIQAEGGVDLARMNRILLEKVEELTLYVLQQQQAIDALKARIEP